MRGYWLLLAASLSLSGCLSKVPAANYYLLRSLPESQAQTYQISPQATLGLGQIEFPEYAARPQLVIRTHDVEVAMNEQQRWAEPIEGQFTQVLADDLTWLLKGHKILQYPWRNGVKPARVLQVQVLQFEGNVKGYANLTAEWQLVDTAKQRVIYTERQKWVMPIAAGQDYYRGYILAMSENIAQLAKAMVKAVNSH